MLDRFRLLCHHTKAYKESFPPAIFPDDNKSSRRRTLGSEDVSTASRIKSSCVGRVVKMHGQTAFESHIG